jgi:manganese/zinc/iron transport system permease protein
MLELISAPLFRGPFWGSLILSVLLSLVGVITFHAKKPLLGEVIAHCSYPGAIFGLMVSVVCVGVESPVLILSIAFVVALLGGVLLKKITLVHTADSSMTLILSGFFGLGVFLSSIIQQKFPLFYRLAQGYLFGQVSTMTDRHIVIYGLCLVVVAFIVFQFFHRIKLGLFDPLQSSFFGGVKIAFIVETLICFCLVLGIRGVGVVLVSSFFVAPAVISLGFCKTFKASIFLALTCAVVLNSLAFLLPLKAPMGPIIVLLLSCVACISLKLRSYAALS